MANSLRETVLEQQLRDMQRRFELMHHTHMVTLTVLVHYIGGEITLGATDYKEAQGVLLTETLDPLGQTRTLRTRRIGKDDASVVDDPPNNGLTRGGLLPPGAGQYDNNNNNNDPN